ncbi:hypothetical protein BDR03DRAFT_984999 [Suillus americanus]|nr:hypothetical protein BDR03DRAFT_984999 [Suillus americanus]
MPSQTDTFIASEWLSCGRIFDQSKLLPSAQFPPLHCITFEAHLAWIEAYDWVLQRLEDEDDQGCSASEVVDEVLDVLEHLLWDVDLKGFGAQASLCTLELLPLLADAMINGHVLDALIAATNDHVDEHNDTAVEMLDFANILLLDNMQWSKYHFDRSFTQLHYLGGSLHNGTIQHVIFPVNIANVHWAIISVDTSAQMILYGDSLGWYMPSSYIDAIHHWLKIHGFTSFGKGSLLHGEQTDSFSCAVAALNTIKHTVFGYPLFTDDSKYRLCIEEFWSWPRVI